MTIQPGQKKKRTLVNLYKDPMHALTLHIIRVHGESTYCLAYKRTQLTRKTGKMFDNERVCEMCQNVYDSQL